MFRKIKNSELLMYFGAWPMMFFAGWLGLFSGECAGIGFFLIAVSMAWVSVSMSLNGE